MKFKELLWVMNECQFADVFYRTEDGGIKEVFKNITVGKIRDDIADIYEEAEVLGLQVSKYNTFDVEIEKVVEPKKYSVHFEVPTWQINDLEYDDEMVFEDGESDEDIEDAIEDAFKEWLGNLIADIEAYAEKEYELIED